jgi:hypothetical protein
VRRVVAVLAAWMVLSLGTAVAREPGAPLSIPLEPLGYQTAVSEFLLAGSSMLTVDFVDKDHLLLTFALRRLMKREVDPPPDDDDRTIGAVLVELPSGKVLARTEWRVHDRWQYLWNLGHGRFLLRMRDQLTVIAPMRATDPDDAFREIPFLAEDRHVVAVTVSSEEDLLTVETTRRPVGPLTTAHELTQAETAPVLINFYRLEDGDKLAVVWAGAIRTKMAIALPMTAAGFLEVLADRKGTWLFNFDEHAGKVNELLAFDSSCLPHPMFVSHSEFVVIGCRGSNDKRDIAGFNLKGDEMWQQNIFESYVSPTFGFAPRAGRFAMGKTILSSPMDPDAPLPSTLVNGQEVRVYQSYNGKILFKIDCSPVQRAGQNFSLSADGMQLAVIRQTVVRHPATKDLDAYTDTKTAVEVYALPPLSDKDRAEVKASDAIAPLDSGARIDVALQRLSGKGKGTNRTTGDSASGHAVASEPDTSAVSNAAPSSAAVADKPAGGANDPGVAVAVKNETETDGDPQPAEPRQPPTLYGPDDKKPQK